MFDNFNAEWVDVVFVAVTGLIAYHGLTYRDKTGNKPFVHLLFGCIALLYCLWILGKDVLHIL